MRPPALPVYKVDTGLLSVLSELRAHEKQAAEEQAAEKSGQEIEKSEPTGDATAVRTSIQGHVGDAGSEARSTRNREVIVLYRNQEGQWNEKAVTAIADLANHIGKINGGRDRPAVARAAALARRENW